MIALAINTWLFIKPGALSHVCFDTDDGIYANFFAFFKKFNRTVHAAVISECERWHAKLMSALYEVGNLRESIEQGVVGVGVKMNKLRLHNTPSIPVGLARKQVDPSQNNAPVC
jgi:hypothetical protein